MVAKPPGTASVMRTLKCSSFVASASAYAGRMEELQCVRCGEGRCTLTCRGGQLRMQRRILVEVSRPGMACLDVVLTRALDSACKSERRNKWCWGEGVLTVKWCGSDKNDGPIAPRRW